MPEALICGAGKIGRGFLGQLLHRSGWILRFLDGSPQVVALLNREKRYRVDIAGRDDLREYIPVAGAFGLDDAAAVRPFFASADLIVSAVGAANIPGLARFIAPLLAARGGKPLDWLICENADAPAKTIRFLQTQRPFAQGSRRSPAWKRGRTSAMNSNASSTPSTG